MMAGRGCGGKAGGTDALDLRGASFPGVEGEGVCILCFNRVISAAEATDIRPKEGGGSEPMAPAMQPQVLRSSWGWKWKESRVAG